ncbi:hypothetical protein JMJ77_0000449 [Colletotrichum scovillei]|uniref:Uncharacterized protein n=1 Tax=Colletotrichum scovillei TaxID=1209932 RepID=A0A9P7RAD1_9PEZI|nr:hypothetical protein JMJ77_0000449 [Colletotrichum scovillei]KAG7071654.1 hypothetical protein JMJ76_0004524 [Colletotrichum scovillei]KAG7079904.1 hypothetical protein JMJ78_0007007 [Colletotrichum scovillei]
MILQCLPDSPQYVNTTWPEGLRTARAAHFCFLVTPHSDPTEQPHPAGAMQQRLRRIRITKDWALSSRPIITSNQTSLAAYIVSELRGFSSRPSYRRPGRRRCQVVYASTIYLKFSYDDMPLSSKPRAVGRKLTGRGM